jgi:hypothetical protein
MQNKVQSNDDFANIDGSSKIKGTPICFGKVKARACVAINIEEAQNIQVFSHFFNSHGNTFFKCF